jgi:hypothetical protein
MNPRSLVVSFLTLLLALNFSGCTSTSSSQLVNSFGPLVTQIAEVEISKAILKKNPAAETALLGVADELDLLSQDASATEITNVVIHNFAVRVGAKYSLSPSEVQVIELGFDSARDAALDSTHAQALHIGDANVGPWLSALKNGLREGVAAYHQSIK